MSLTRELSRKDSWVNRFFKERFPQVVDFARREGVTVKSLKTEVPCESPSSARLVGTAFDYRLRMHFEPDFADSDELSIGIDRLRSTGSGLGTLIDQKWADSTRRLLADLPANNADLMARASIVLAWLDWGYRSGGDWSEGLRATAGAIRDGRDISEWDAYTTPVDKAVAAEVANLMRLANPPKADTAECGTSFDGSGSVGGADADLVLDGCLYDVKTTMYPRRELPSRLRQLIGYALLDWDDKLMLTRVGFYFSRQGAWMSWNLSDLVRQSATSGDTLRGLREDFRSLAQARSPRIVVQVA